MAAEPARSGAAAPAEAGGGSPPPTTTGSFAGTFVSRPDRERIEQRPRGRKLAIKECFSPSSGIAPTAPNVYGALSLVVWALTLVVSVKYLSFIMRADNRGEGGILALLALIQRGLRGRVGIVPVAVLITLGLFGAA